MWCREGECTLYVVHDVVIGGGGGRGKRFIRPLV